eukprot:8983-Heterococcus_DN1.PRE.2
MSSSTMHTGTTLHRMRTAACSSCNSYRSAAHMGSQTVETIPILLINHACVCAVVYGKGAHGCLGHGNELSCATPNIPHTEIAAVQSKLLATSDGPQLLRRRCFLATSHSTAAALLYTWGAGKAGQVRTSISCFQEVVEVSREHR